MMPAWGEGDGHSVYAMLPLFANEVPSDVDLLDAILAQEPVLLVARMIGMPGHAQAHRRASSGCLR